MSQSSNSNSSNDSVYWLIALGLIFTGFAAPIGVLMLVLKFLGGGRSRGRHPYYSQQRNSEQTGARTTAASSMPEPAPKKRGRKTSSQNKLAELDNKGKTLTILGGVLTALFTLAIFSSMGDAVYWLLDGEIRWFLQELFNLVPLLCFGGAGLGCLWAGLRKRKQTRRWRNYLAMAGSQKSISISALASASGLSPYRVREDLADMLDHGLFPQGFLDYGGDRLVLHSNGLTDEASARPAEQPAPSPAPSQDQENTILTEIKEVNDAIDDEKMSAQIDRIGIITARILDYQKTHPDKAPQLHSFLSYYLPTTLKILRAYAQLEDQEVSGENITAAMQRIEGMMDKVVEGFEKQLDLLFQGDAMDITTDVEVLERMLAKDGLSDSQGLTLGI